MCESTVQSGQLDFAPISRGALSALHIGHRGFVLPHRAADTAHVQTTSARRGWLHAVRAGALLQTFDERTIRKSSQLGALVSHEPGHR